MTKSQYNKARAAILMPEGQTAHTAFLATYDQRPEIIAGRRQMRRDEQAQDIRLVCEAVTRFTAEHPKLAVQYQIGMDGTWGELAKALYDCYAHSGKMVGAPFAGHGSFITDVDPYDIQSAYMAAGRLAR